MACFCCAQKEPFYIYGTGFVARRLLDVLVHRGIIENLRGFVVTKMPEDGSHEFFGKSVQPITEIPRESLILVAVHMIWEDEIEQNLLRLGFQRFVMVYDKLLEIQFGAPKVHHQKIRVREQVARLAKTVYERYAMTAYLSAIQKHVHGAPGSDAYYLKFQGALATPKAAKVRLERFHQMIDEFRSEGERALQRHPVCFDEHGNVLDGMHRMSTAYAFHVPFLFADIYDTEEYWGMGYEKGFWKRSYAEIFSPEELQEMDAMQDALFSGAEE